MPQVTLTDCGLLLPFAEVLVAVLVATVTLRELRTAVTLTRKVAATVVEFTTATLLTATPAPCTFTVAGLVKRKRTRRRLGGHGRRHGERLRRHGFRHWCRR